MTKSCVVAAIVVFPAVVLATAADSCDSTPCGQSTCGAIVHDFELSCRDFVLVGCNCTGCCYPGPPPPLPSPPALPPALPPQHPDCGLPCRSGTCAEVIGVLTCTRVARVCSCGACCAPAEEADERAEADDAAGGVDSSGEDYFGYLDDAAQALLHGDIGTFTGL
eukprot:2512137-Prymnesium_polylepis.1